MKFEDTASHSDPHKVTHITAAQPVKMIGIISTMPLAPVPMPVYVHVSHAALAASHPAVFIAKQP